MDYETAMEHAARTASPNVLEVVTVGGDEGATITYVNAAHVIKVWTGADGRTWISTTNGPPVLRTNEPAKSFAERLAGCAGTNRAPRAKKATELHTYRAKHDFDKFTPTAQAWDAHYTHIFGFHNGGFTVEAVDLPSAKQAAADQHNLNPHYLTFEEVDHG